MTPKSALVTGASRGIGRGIAIELARAGYRVAINYAGNAEAAAEALALVKAAGGDGFIVQGDVAVAADRERLVAETVAQFGRIDLLVNNAGVAPKVRADLLDAGEESFDRLYAINLKGPFFLSSWSRSKCCNRNATPRASAAAWSTSPRSPSTPRPSTAATTAW